MLMLYHVKSLDKKGLAIGDYEIIDVKFSVFVLRDRDQC